MENDDFEVTEESNLFTEIGQKYIPYWPIFALLIVIAMASGYIYLRYATPIYETSAKLLVKDDKKGVDASKVLDALDVFGEKKIVENEIEILKSWPIMTTVVKKLGLYAAVFHKGDVRDVEYYGKETPVIFKAVSEDSIHVFDGMKPLEFSFEQQNKCIKIKDLRYYNNDTIEIGSNKFIIQFYQVKSSLTSRFKILSKARCSMACCIRSFFGIKA